MATIVSLDMCLKPCLLVSDWLQVLCVLPVSTDGRWDYTIVHVVHQIH